MSDLSNVTTGKAFSSSDFTSNGNYNVITNKNIGDYQKNRNFVGDKINIDDERIKQQYVLFGANILVTMDGVNIGVAGLYSDNNAVLAQRVGRLRSNQPFFVFQLVMDNKFKAAMKRESVGNAIKHISVKQIQDYESYVPSELEERNEIGCILKNIDDLIVANERQEKIAPTEMVQFCSFFLIDFEYFK
ncbi:hypothetical protein HEQ45_00670 [Lactobacillus sp. ZJLC29-4]|uniref:Type I restriction modification DNA specificity domain-containing protein n=1 Tax=Levilactobacillus tujiorum TaxID=2912243 RepID=A0ABX1L120_9LACO|nr:restriction endonuclease subunit S [Levilactobacillus tujiorum]NLR10940.1 hypothetical protein [Lactobacillus sp. HBUAS51387]NLR28720.1 hypothetical protein [Levilactobacillus tujiorum]